MTLNKLASLIAKYEGKKHQASVGDIREILKIIVLMELEWLNGVTMPDSPIGCINDRVDELAQRLSKKKGKK